MRIIAALVGLSFALTPTAYAACSGSVQNNGQRYVISAGEVFDKQTGLTWRRCSVGMTWAGRPGCAGEKKLLNSAAAQRAASDAGAGWRVPNVAELSSLLDASCGTPAIDTTIFPDVTANEQEESGYWSTTKVGMANLIYYVDFLTGNVDGHSKGFQLALRLVRTGK